MHPLLWQILKSSLASREEGPCPNIWAVVHESCSPAKGRPGLKVVVKSQVLAGGRGLGTFKNGFKGGVHIVDVDQAKKTAEKMLGQVLVTKQTGEGGKPVNTLYMASKLDLVNEMYFAILLDRATAGPMLIGCSEGEAPLTSARNTIKNSYL